MRVGKMLQEHFLDLRADQEGFLALIHHARAKTRDSPWQGAETKLHDKRKATGL